MGYVICVHFEISLYIKFIHVENRDKETDGIRWVLA